jgi:hypothetical protein
MVDNVVYQQKQFSPIDVAGFWTVIIKNDQCLQKQLSPINVMKYDTVIIEYDIHSENILPQCLTQNRALL